MSDWTKPCAHCGGGHMVEEWRRQDDQTDDWTVWRIMCGMCGVSTDWHASREAALAVWNNRPNEPTCKSEQEDSRERLISDVMATVGNLVEYGDANLALIEKAKSWLDRQEVITRNECREEHRQRLSELHDLLDEAARERENLQEQVGRLTTSVKKWTDAAKRQRLVAIEQTDKAQKLTDERAKLIDKLIDVTIERDTYKKFWESSK